MFVQFFLCFWHSLCRLAVVLDAAHMLCKFSETSLSLRLMGNVVLLNISCRLDENYYIPEPLAHNLYTVYAYPIFYSTNNSVDLTPCFYSHMHMTDGLQFLFITYCHTSL